MSKLRALALVACAYLFAPSPAHAAEARIITFDEAVRIALEQNAVLRQAKNLYGDRKSVV